MFSELPFTFFYSFFMVANSLGREYIHYPFIWRMDTPSPSLLTFCTLITYTLSKQLSLVVLEMVAVRPSSFQRRPMFESVDRWMAAISHVCMGSCLLSSHTERWVPVSRSSMGWIWWCPPKLIYWSLNCQWNGISRWDLENVIRSGG